ncbi:hypothetical protein WJX81_007935 [Elliptochloris bilobata]|uniref:Late embryogenesis abundant protein LEA-2 subgroup domain-containing protein n=1 Tax=Elliptochloris bilobata TaxID=381761 RepID=A0AAW1RWP1_9CHLO
MQTYTRLADVTGQETGDDLFSPPFSSEYEIRPASTWSRVKLWWRVHILGEPSEPVIPSGYLTLIPLNDARLKPQRRVCLYLCMVLFVLAAMATTFLLVPRGFSAGEIDIQADKMSWNVTKGTYQLKLLARIPIHNPNFLKATASGVLSVYFYDTLAGSQSLAPTAIAARADPQVVEVNIDASDVPSEYALTILSECAAFPRRLVFFLKGTLSVKDYIQTINLAPIDTYFMLNCFNTSAEQTLPRTPGSERQRLQ